MKTDTKYHRELPRDLFNEAKLLKCMGRLCLLIHDGLVPVKMEFEEPHESFEIGLVQDGYLTIVNLPVYIKGEPYRFKTTYNSKSEYPLFIEHGDCEHRVFNEEGKFDQEFLDFCKQLKKQKLVSH